CDSDNNCDFKVTSIVTFDPAGNPTGGITWNERQHNYWYYYFDHDSTQQYYYKIYSSQGRIGPISSPEFTYLSVCLEYDAYGRMVSKESTFKDEWKEVENYRYFKTIHPESAPIAYYEVQFSNGTRKTYQCDLFYY